MKKIVLFACLLGLAFTNTFAQDIRVSGSWILDNVELSDFADTEFTFTEEDSFFAFYLDKANKLDLSQSILSLNVGGEQYTYEVKFKNGELLLSSSNTVYVKKNDAPVQTQLAVGETVFKVKQVGNKLILFRKNQTFYERYTFIAAN